MLAARSGSAPGLEQFGGAQDEQRGGAVAELERPHAGEQAPESAPQHRAHLQADRPPLPCARSPHAPHGGEHRDGREQSRHDRDEHRRAHVEHRDQRDREQRPHDRPEIVSGALEPVGAPVRLGRHHVGEDRVAARTAHAARSPGAGSQHEHLPRRGREPDAAREHRGRDVAPDRDLRAALRVVGERPAGQLRDARRAVGDAFDQPQGRRRRTQRHREEARQQRRRDLVAHVGQEARQPDRSHSWVEPWRLGIDRWRPFGIHDPIMAMRKFGTQTPSAWSGRHRGAAHSLDSPSTEG